MPEIVTICIPPGLYNSDVVLRAAYSMADRCHASVRPDGDSIVVRLESRDDSEASGRLEDEFSSRLIDFELRARITRETKVIREQIYREAFAQGGLLEEPGL